MTVVSPKKHSDAERVADISRRLMENPGNRQADPGAG